MMMVDVFIAKVRRKLARAGAGNPIETVWGRGYTISNEIEQQVPETDDRPFAARPLSFTGSGAGRASGGSEADSKTMRFASRPPI